MEPVCPTPGHKDIYVEIDYMANHVPSSDAIKKVITSFGNAPVSNSNPDAFGRRGRYYVARCGERPVWTRGPFNVWTDATPSLDDFVASRKLTLELQQSVLGHQECQE